MNKKSPSRRIRDAKPADGDSLRDVLFFAGPDDFREWLSANHDSQEAQWVGYYKKATGRPSITWPESVDEALCFGWIDGLRKSIDGERYKIRFTQRRAKSNWSEVNIRRIKELEKRGRVLPPGRRAFEDRKKVKTAYSYEREEAELSPAYVAEIQDNRAAWEFFNSLSPSVRKTTIHWVMSAKREETRLRRLGVLIESSENQEKVPPLNIGKPSRRA